jgi:hypothetical protein
MSHVKGHDTLRQGRTRSRIFSPIEHEQAVAAKVSGILKLRDLIAWESFLPLLEELTSYATHDWAKGGKPPFDPVLMFKVLVLKKFHGLSDDATEEQIFDRTSFKNFLGLRIGDDIPDAKTLWDFKQRIEVEGREGSRKLFDALEQEEQRGPLRVEEPCEGRLEDQYHPELHHHALQCA